MKIAKLMVFAGAVLFAVLTPASAQWIKQSVETTASLRGLSVVDEKVIWASGTGGTVIRTIDGGRTWDVMQVPEAGKLDFRDVEAFDANTAYILSIGNGESSRIYKTTDGGKNWNLQFKNTNEKAFFDAIACWDRNNCIAMSDPVDSRFVLIKTTDGGMTWKPIDTATMPATKDGEAAFAASGTCLITQGKYNAFIVSGGSDARVFRSTDRGSSWSVSDTPIVKGSAGSGIFSIAMFDDKHGAVVGGNYEKPNENANNLAFTKDGGRTWKMGKGLGGYRSGITYSFKRGLFAVGSSGSDFSSDGGKVWRAEGKENLNAVQAFTNGSSIFIWAVGANGLAMSQFQMITTNGGFDPM
jgi:photosystem II stability/assembly factor-like uncharacterized protein